MKLVLDWRYVQESCWFDLQDKWASASATWIAIKPLHLQPHNMNEVQNSTAQIMKQE